MDPIALRVLKRAPKHPFLVVGDVMLDENYYGELPEPAVHHTYHKGDSYTSLDVRDPRKHTALPGGAAKLCHFLKRLGADANCCGVIGRDGRADLLAQAFSSAGLSPEYLVASNDRPTTQKLRIFLDDDNPVLRALVNLETRAPLPAPIVDIIKDHVTALAPACAAIVLEDFEKGVVSTELARHCYDVAERHGKALIVHPKFHWQVFECLPGIDCVVCSMTQFSRGVLGHSAAQSPTPTAAEIAVALDTWPQVERWIVNCGEEGAIFWSWRGGDRVEAEYTLVSPSAALETPEKTIGFGRAFAAGAVLGYVSMGANCGAAASFGTIVATEHARGRGHALPDKPRIETQSAAPTISPATTVRCQWAFEAKDIVESLGEEYRPAWVVAETVADRAGQLVTNAQRILEFIEGRDSSLLIVGGSGSGKTSIVEAILRQRNVKFAKEIATACQNEPEGPFRRLLASDFTVLVLDEYLKAASSFRDVLGPIHEGRIALPGVTPNPSLGNKKVIAIGSIVGPLETALDLDERRRFRCSEDLKEVIEIPQVVTATEVVDIFATALLKRHGELSASLGLLAGAIVKWHSAGANARSTIAGWAKDVVPAEGRADLGTWGSLSGDDNRKVMALKLEERFVRLRRPDEAAWNLQ